MEVALTRAAREEAGAKAAVLAALAPYWWAPDCRADDRGWWSVWLLRADGAEGTIGSGSTAARAWADALGRVRAHGVPQLRAWAGFAD